LPVVQAYLKVGIPYKGQPHMVLPWVLNLLADDILRAEPMPKSRNIELLMARDPIEKGVNDRAVGSV
jgi:hypothetical protein